MSISTSGTAAAPSLVPLRRSTDPGFRNGTGELHIKSRVLKITIDTSSFDLRVRKTKNVSLTPELETVIAEPVASGRYRSSTEVRAALAFWNAGTLLSENAIATL